MLDLFIRAVIASAPAPVGRLKIIFNSHRRGRHKSLRSGNVLPWVRGESVLIRGITGFGFLSNSASRAGARALVSAQLCPDMFVRGVIAPHTPFFPLFWSG